LENDQEDGEIRTGRTLTSTHPHPKLSVIVVFQHIFPWCSCVELVFLPGGWTLGACHNLLVGWRGVYVGGSVASSAPE
jgi:hypothetical protein